MNKDFTLNIKALFDASAVKAGINDLQNALKSLKLPDKLTTDLKNSFINVEKALNDFENRSVKGVKTKADATGLSNSIDKVVTELTKLDGLVGKVKKEIGEGVDLSQVIKLDKDSLKSIQDLEKEASRLKQEISTINTSKLKELQNILGQIKGEKTSGQVANIIETFKQGDIQGSINLLNELIEKQKTLENGVANRTGTITNNIKILEEQLKGKLVEALNETSSKTTRLGEIAQEQGNIARQAYDKTVQSVNDLSQSVTNYGNQAQQVAPKVKKAADEQVRLNTELAQVKSRIEYLLGLANAINLVKRAIRQAFETVKELDKAMTETAVVTKNTISDMWAKLPEYTKRANQLGVSTLDAYKAATLYYQQGLNDEQAAVLSTETLKMARIAGLEAAEATDRMTNALRGFNMELNALNAQRVDDVYSQLAAHSASNVDEISTAMTKVASLAHSANMEFETTAAFLAQIIETTRESAETAGTALKTVVARFSEVKKLVNENQLKGTDEEGQAIDVNKVSAALRTAGIDLNKYFLGEVGLDDIFMELASKWDNLTSVQQRYIATQAAGSRQQSRFIALMQDYARTQELVGMAYDAEGASAKQFEKTQDSLQSKIARLKNAWNQFLMGLANSTVIKKVIDLLTKLINFVNNLTGVLGDGVGTILKWVTALSAFAGIKKFFNSQLFSNFLGKVGNSPIGKFFGWNKGVNDNNSGQAFSIAVDNAGNRFVNDTKAAGEILKKAARDASNIEKRGAVEEGNIEKASAVEEGNIEKVSAIENGNIEKASAVVEGNTEVSYAIKEGEIELAAARAKAAIESNAFKGFYQTFLNNGGIPAGQGLLKSGNIVAGAGTTGGSGGMLLLPAAGGTTGGVGTALTSNTSIVATSQSSTALVPASSGVSLGGISKGLGIIGAIIAVLALAGKAIHDFGAPGQAKFAEEQATLLSEVADNAKKVSDNYRKASKSIKQYNNAIKELGPNADPSEYADLVQERNDYIQELIKEDEHYAEFVTSTFENGKLVLTLDEDKLNEAIASFEQTQAFASATSSFSEAATEYWNSQNYWPEFWAEMKHMNLFGDYEVHDEVLMEQAKTDASAQKAKYLAKQGYAELIDTDKINKDTAALIADALGENYKASEQFTWLNSGWWRTKGYWKGEYYKEYGTQADENLTAAEIYKLVLAGRDSDRRKDQINSLNTLLTGPLGKEYAEVLKQYLGTETFSDVNLTLSNIDDFELFNTNLENLATILGITEAQLKQIIKDNIKNRQEAQKKYNAGTAAQIVQTGWNLGWGEDKIASRIADILALPNFNEQYAIGELLRSVPDDLIVGQVLDNLNDSKLREWLTSLDFSDPINNLLKIQDAAKNGATPAIRELASALKETDQYSPSSLFNYFITSSDYEQLSSDLDDFVEKNGEITSTNILDLAEANSTLNNLLKTGVMSAKALAVALTGIQKNDIQMWDLNSAVIAALNSMDDLDGVVNRTIDDLNNFDPGYDENDVTGFINKVIENAQGNIDKGAWGNNQMQNYLEYIFGSYSGEPGDEYRTWITDNLAWLNANKDNMKSAWMDIAGSSAESAAVYGDGVKVWQENGEILIDTAGHTTDDLVKILAEGTKLTEQQIRMMIADYKNYSDDFALLLKDADTKKAIEKWAAEVRERGYYLDSELETLAKLLGKKKEEIQKLVSEVFATDGVPGAPKQVNWNNDQSVASNVKKVLQATNQSYTSEWKDEEGKEHNVLDFNKLKASMDKADLSGYFEQTLNEMAQAGQWFYADFGNGLEKVAIKANETAMEAYKRTAQDKANEALANSIGKAVVSALEGEHNITIGANTDDANAKIAALFGDLDKKLKVDYNTTVNIDTKTAVGNVNTLTTALNNLAAAIANVAGTSTPYKGASNADIPNTHALGAGEAKGGIVGSYGSGSYRVSPGVALTGEEGPEIVWNKEKGYAYITGKQNPQFQDLQPGDRIFDAQETKKILSMAKGGEIFHSYAGQPSHSYDDTKAGGKGAGSGKDKKSSAEWKNELDWLYNLLEDIAELERDQKDLEEKFEDILTDQAKTSKDLYKLLIERLANLNIQLERQTFALQKREQEMREFMDTTNDQDKYLWYNWADRTIEIDWDAIDKIVDGDLYKHVKELIGEAEEIQGKMDDAEDAIADIQNQIQELENIWRDTYVDFEERVLDALVQSYQEVIDNYSELNDTLNDTNSEILNAIQQEIDLERQIRDNTKTEDDIAQKEARLAYLQRDTTGANATEILKLQQEIEDSRQSYEDTLVDQAVQRLQEDNDAAAKQREEQIEIMQAQLDYSKKAGEFNEQVTSLIQNALSPEGTLLTNSDLYVLLSKQENWSAMSEVNKQIWEEELTSTFKEVGAYLLKTYADWNGQFYQELANSINTVNEKYKISVGSYSQAKAGGSSGSGSGGGGGGGSTTTTPPNNTGPKDEWIDQGVSPTWDCNSGYHWRNRVYYNPKQKKTKTEVEPGTKGTHTSNEISRTATTITYKCSVCGYTWTGTNRSGTTSTNKTLIGGGGCFAPGTHILMGDYKVRNIEDIKINDIIMAYDEENDEFIPKKVMKAYVHHNTPKMVKLTFSNGVILNLTPGHPLYSTDGWKSLDIENSLLEHKTKTTLLKINDTIVNINDNAQVTNIEYLNVGLNYDSYNIEVEDCHTFIANGFVAHNSKKIDDRAYYYMYATGGLNTKTGPAWLDGTPSEPEYVLNARQTQAFLKLADVLPNIMSNNSASTNNYGGNVYLDLTMNVDEIGSDYDVDRIANRVKDIIYDASSYRNVNTLNFIR